MESVGTPVLWGAFTVFILLLLAVDLGLFHRTAHAVSHREAIIWTAIWISLAVAFNVWIFLNFGGQRGLEFLTGYLIEYSLSIDNIFVFLIIFRYFSVPAESQHRALFWGILGALVMRAAFVLVGAVLIETFHWIIYVFGAFLVFTGVKMLRGSELEVHPDTNPAVKLFRKIMAVTPTYQGAKFFIRQNGKLLATPLLLVLVVVEATDVVFAVDSIPAIFGVTRDPFIVFTSNVFAILGLRSLYFLLAAAMREFHFLKLGLGAVLSFIGIKMLLSEIYEIPILLSLFIVGLLLGGSVAASFVWKQKSEAPAAGGTGSREGQARMVTDPVCKM